jgi:hypothetical protein
MDIDAELKNALDRYLEKIGDDYEDRRSGGESGDPDRVYDFRRGLTCETGKKYVKIITQFGRQRHVHSFVMIEDDDKFKRGDILKAASWKTPARNHARGNILTDTYRTAWTGAPYLK